MEHKNSLLMISSPSSLEMLVGEGKKKGKPRKILEQSPLYFNDIPVFFLLSQRKSHLDYQVDYQVLIY